MTTHTLRAAAGAWIAFVLVGAPCGAAEEGERAAADTFLRTHCVKCHGADKPKGDVRLDDLAADPMKAADRWAAVRDQVRDGLMPPAKEPKPDQAAARKLVAWVTAGIAEQAPRLPNQGNLMPHELLFGPGTAAPAPPPGRVWRLGPDDYTGWLAEVYRGRLPILTQPFTLTPERGIRDFAGLYTIDEPATEILVRNAETIVAYQTGTAAKKIGPGGDRLPEFAKLMDRALTPTRAQLEAAIQTQFKLAIGRPATAEDVNRFIALYEKCSAADGDRPAAVKIMLQAVLLKTDSLYRSEIGGGAANGSRLLASDEVVRAVSLALGHRREAGLTTAAQKGELKTREQVAGHVRRLLDEPKTSPRLLEFFREYFEYHKATEVFKDKPRGFHYEPRILVSDTDALVKSIVDADKDVLKELLTTPKSFVNLRLMEVKGMRGVFASTAAQVVQYRPDKGEKKPFGIDAMYGFEEFQKQQPVTVPASTPRLGILMQPSWLAAWSTNFDNDPVRRGRWVRERLLGGTVPDIPIGVDAKVPDEPENTFRHRLRVTREGRCLTCHQKMDNLGLPFEQFDHFGRYRTTEMVVDLEATAKNIDPKSKKPLGHVMKGDPVIATGAIAGTGVSDLEGPVKDPYEFVRKLGDSPRVRQVFVRHAFRYFLGRNECLSDAHTLQMADKAYSESGGSFKALVASLLTSDSFLYRVTPIFIAPSGDRK